MPTFAAPTPINKPGKMRRNKAFTLAELVVVILIVSLFVLLPQINLLNLFGRNNFKAQTQRFISTFNMAAASAAQSDRRYEIIIDIGEQSYLLRQITNPDLSEVLDEEIILEDRFTDTCQVSDVLFDDGEFANESRVKFRIGRSGWQYGGRIALVDRDGQIYSVLISRLDRAVKLQKGLAQILEPRLKDELPF
jgi:prepilin-type N-terminal cleavage/methylation domain-containing protein